MKKTIAIGLLLAGLMALSVFAYVPTKKFQIGLAYKDPSTWNILKTGGTLQGKQIYITGNTPTDVLELGARNLKPLTDYTLIYYGDGTHNDVWNYVTCIASGKSRLYGTWSTGVGFNWSRFLNDGKDQKFWVVPSADVDCLNGRMTAWNPSDILFETATI